MILDESYNEIRDMVAKFSDSEVAPLAHDIDKNAAMPKELIGKLGENGLLGSYIPEEYGGAGMDYTSYSIIMPIII